MSGQEAALVDEKLMPLEERLQHILEEIKDLEQSNAKGQDAAESVRKLQNRLSHIDHKYREGKFEVNGQIPQGQAVLSEQLNSAHDRLHRLLEAV